MADISVVNGLPRHKGANVYHENDLQEARHNNQFLLTGVNPQFPDPFGGKDYVVFLEFVKSSTVFEIQDADGNSLATGIASPFGDAHAPLRLDGGVKLVGTITAAKGFFIIK